MLYINICIFFCIRKGLFIAAESNKQGFLYSEKNELKTKLVKLKRTTITLLEFCEVKYLWFIVA